MFRALVNVVPGVDKDGTTVFMDGFRGCEQSLEAFNADVNRTICVKHRAEVIKKNLGAEDAKTALAAIYAKSPRALEKRPNQNSAQELNSTWPRPLMKSNTRAYMPTLDTIRPARAPSLGINQIWISVNHISVTPLDLQI